MNYPPVGIGDRFGRWTVVGGPLVSASRYLRWECRCACGRVKVVWGTNLKRGKSRSCGCFKREWGREPDPAETCWTTDEDRERDRQALAEAERRRQRRARA